MGLGTIARIVASGEEIYAGKLPFAEAQRRIERLYQPYHRALRGLVDETKALFGGCLLLDCHSMPSGADSPCGKSGAYIVLGDCHGLSCAPQLVEAARRFLVEHGFAVAINAPVPSASPALRTIGWRIEALYWAHGNHGTSQMRG